MLSNMLLLDLHWLACQQPGWGNGDGLVLQSVGNTSLVAPALFLLCRKANTLQLAHSLHRAACQQVKMHGVRVIIRTVSTRQAASPCFAETIGLVGLRSPQPWRPSSPRHLGNCLRDFLRPIGQVCSTSGRTRCVVGTQGVSLVSKHLNSEVRITLEVKLSVNVLIVM